MKNKLKKQKRKLFTRIIAGMFALSLLVYAYFIMETINNNYLFQQMMVSNNTAYDLNMINGFREKNDYLKFIINLGNDWEVDRMICDEEKNVILKRENALSVGFSVDANEIETILGRIHYEPFRKSISDEQFETISKYLNAPDQDDNHYYELMCTEFYSLDSEFTPTKVTVAYIDESGNEAIVEHKESFVLNATVPEGAQHYVIGEPYRNSISKEFIFNGSAYESLIEKVKAEFADEDGDVWSDTYFVEPFTYIVYSENPIVLNGENVGWFIDAERVNVLEGCITPIITMGICIFVVFITTGIIIGAVIWKTLKKQIEQENRLRTVTNAMAHELKTPLFVIGGFAENLTENINTDKREHYSSLITEQTAEMNKLVSKMLEYSKLDSASFTLKKEKFALDKLAKEIVEKYDFSEIELDCDEEVFVNADKALIKTAIENLVENAVKYSDGSGKIIVACKNGKLTVSNPYKEVSAEEIKNMWEPYHRSADENDKEGHGIGLAMVKSIMDLHTAKCRAEYSNNRISFTLSF